MSIHSRRRRAFSLVELLVILAVMMIAVSLTLPAILRARQAAREESCRNNLKQLGLALHNYHDVYGVFAPAWCARFSEADSPAWMGWQAALLPFVEQAALYNLMYQDKNAPEWPAGGKIERTAISVYQCPMDSTGGVNPFRGGFGTSNYSGNFGPELLPRWFESSAEEFWPGAVASPQNSTGIFRHNRCTGIREILDGTSNTVMVGERSALSGAGIWMGVRSNRHENDVISDMNHLSGVNKSWAGLSGRHDGKVNLLLCDGAVRLVNQDINSRADGMGVLQLLSSKDDGQVIGDF